MKQLLLLISILLLATGAFFLFQKEEAVSPVVEEPTPIVEENLGQPTFLWSYLTGEVDGIPMTEISLTATYENGQANTKLIDGIEGTCNEYPEPDADVYENSTMIICYYAGLGHYFKIVEENGQYLVQRRVFEEASPDYNPPIEDFKTIATF